MTIHKSALSDLSSRLLGTDGTLTNSIADILAAAFQRLIEAKLTARIDEHAPRTGERGSRAAMVECGGTGSTAARSGWATCVAAATAGRVPSAYLVAPLAGDRTQRHAGKLSADVRLRTRATNRLR